MTAQHRYRKWYATAAVAVVLGAAVFALTQPLRRDGVPALSLRAGAGVSFGDSGPSGVGPSGVVDGVPVGWERSVEGARAAGEAYVELTGEVIGAGPLRRDDMTQAFATPAYAATLLADTEEVLDGIGGALGVGYGDVNLAWEEWALTSEATLIGDGMASVQVWSVAVFSVDSASVAFQFWRTSVLRLEWRDGDWKVAEWGNTASPYPSPLAGQQISPIEDVTSVLAWRRRVGAPA
jgi:hypothetical protein